MAHRRMRGGRRGDVGVVHRPPYVEFDTAAMPNLAAYGMAVPTMVLIVSALRHRDRIPVAVLALIGVFSVHTTAGVVVALFVAAWWAVDGLWHPVPGASADVVTLLLVALPSALLLLPQFNGILQQADIIVGHSLTPRRQEEGAVRRGRRPHPPPQRLSDPMGADGAGGGGLGGPAAAQDYWWPLAVWRFSSCRSCIRRRRSAAAFGALSARSATSSTATRVDSSRWSRCCSRRWRGSRCSRWLASRGRQPGASPAGTSVLRRHRGGGGRGEHRHCLVLLSAARVPVRRESATP